MTVREPTLLSCARSLLGAWPRPIEPRTMPDWLGALPAPALGRLIREWAIVGARDAQAAPQTGPDDWTVWLMMGGRGAGKTRSGAEWAHAMALGKPWIAPRPARRLALIGETLADVRDVMIEGPSGILAIAEAAERPTFTAARRRLDWPNGALAFLYSAEDPDSLRGGQFEAAWGDEVAKWPTPSAPSTCCNSPCGWASGRARCSPPRPGRSRSSSGCSPIRARR